MKAILYLAHGSRREAANEEFISFMRKIMNKSDVPIQAYGFLEHAEPSIAQAIKSCIEQGAREITVIPILLLPGVHANEDIPAEFKAFPEVVFHYARPLGADEIMVELLIDRLAAAGYDQREDETVLLVGHGSRESAAAVEFEKVARALNYKIKADVHTAYLTTPVFYQEKLKELAAQKVYLLPFLLFSGDYTVKIEKEIGELDGYAVMCRPVGFDEKLIPLIQKRANEVCT